MKKLYKQFNNLNIETDLEPMEVSDLEKERVKKNLMKGKKKRHISRNFSVAAALLVASSITFSFAFPTIAAKLPIMGDIFELFNNDEEYVFEKHNTYSTDIGLSEESNGINVTVTDAVYDGENITVAYTIKSEKDLGDRPILEGKLVADEFEDKYEHSGFSENYIIEKISEKEYVVVYNYELIKGPKPDEVHITWEGDTILDLNNVSNAFLGDWSFQFTLNALESETQKFTGGSIITEEEGIEILVTKMTETPISTTLYFSEAVDIRLIAKEDEELRVVLIEYTVSDNLGNKYNTIHYRDIGHSTDFPKTRRSYPRLTTTNFHEEATSLTITPIVNIYKKKDNDTLLELVKEPYTIEPIHMPLNK
ncbi:DUF4179 domain-containing protein [Psychrobacillus sp. INOP01]|uniref:DUF4179 domain-containing protein n=1 Tax=Psychrobacillus sp. INOP01 TaxID=2829187 RepID=UPI001BA68F3D|nr:DUF4179 domain-containing protein [Psychrobacillus sp. INOP01]QUG41662.1 DUF4179 domain-containing protein [Psychrobacillus sp. INOP01]